MAYKKFLFSDSRTIIHRLQKLAINTMQFTQYLLVTRWTIAKLNVRKSETNDILTELIKSAI